MKCCACCRRLVLAETNGNNKHLNGSEAGWRLRGQAEEAAKRSYSATYVAMLRQWITQVDVMPLNLLGMAKRVFRERFESAIVREMVGAFEKLDALLKTARHLGRYCCEVVVAERN